MTVRHLFRFGEFELSVDERTLQRGDENIALTPKMYELLLVLARNQNKILSKEFLLETVWPDSFVEEGNISFNIAQLRKTLGDNAQLPLYIETVPRRGYRFIAKVGEFAVDDESFDDLSSPQRPVATPLLPWRMILTLATVLALLLAALVVTAWLFRTQVTNAVPILTAPLALQKLTADGKVFHAAISPDGKTVVYSRSNSGKQSLWLRQLESTENTEIVPASDADYYGLAFSPDNRSIYFTRAESNASEVREDIFRESIFGGVPKKIISDTEGWISIAPAGDIISFVRCAYSDREYCSLWLAEAVDGQNERKLFSTERPFRIADNRISPDGKTLAFAVGQSQNASSDFGVSLIDIESGSQRQLTTERFFNINSLVWLPGGDSLLMTARRQPEANFRIWQVNALTGEASALTADSASYTTLSLSDDGRSLVSSQVEANFNLNVYQADKSGLGPKVLGSGSSASYAPDGRIVFTSMRTGNNEIWITDADRGQERQLTSNPAEDLRPIVSNDGQFIFFASNRSGAIQVWRMNLDGTDQVQVTLGEGGFPGAFSPDGLRLYFKSAMRKRIMQVSLQDGREEVVFDRFSNDSEISPDGRHVVLSEKRGGETLLNVLSLDDPPISRTYALGDASGSLLCFTWGRDSSYFAYVLIDRSGRNSTVWFQPLEATAPQKAADLREEQVFESSGLALSKDGKAFVVSQGAWNYNTVLIKGFK